MRTIHKFPLALTAEQWVNVPGLLKVLAVQMQNGVPTLWCAVSNNQPAVNIHVHILGTGHSIPDGVSYTNHIATLQDGGFVWHVFLYEAHH